MQSNVQSRGFVSRSWPRSPRGDRTRPSPSDGGYRRCASGDTEHTPSVIVQLRTCPMWSLPDGYGYIPRTYVGSRRRRASDRRPPRPTPPASAVRPSRVVSRVAHLLIYVREGTPSHSFPYRTPVGPSNGLVERSRRCPRAVPNARSRPVPGGKRFYSRPTTPRGMVADSTISSRVRVRDSVAKSPPRLPTRVRTSCSRPGATASTKLQPRSTPPDRTLAIETDVTDPESVADAIGETVDTFGGLIVS